MKIACILIDNRPLYYLNNVFKNFIHHLTLDDQINDYEFFFHTCKHSSQFLESSVQDQIKIVECLPENYFDAKLYNMYVTSYEFWSRYQDYDRVLFFQHDTILVKSGLFIDNEKFIKANPYIGAIVPLHTLDHFPKEYELILHGSLQNGGLSIRDPKAFLNAIMSDNESYLRLSDLLCEDSYFGLFFRTRPHDIFYEYSPHDSFKILKNNTFYGLHLNHTNISNDPQLRFSKDSQELIKVPFATHLFSYEYNYLNHKPLFKQILEDQTRTLELTYLSEYFEN